MAASHLQQFRPASLALILLLCWVPIAGAQSIVDARRVEFTPSPDHDVLDPDGVALVTSYTIQVFAAGGATPLQNASLGKPAPDPDGMIRVDFVALLGSPLAPGVTYEALVEAVGPGGGSGGTRSNTFSFSTPCAYTISPAAQSFTAAAASASSTVTAGAGCAWTAASNAPWLAVTAGATGSGNGVVTFSVAANTATSIRTGTLTIAGSPFTATQAAGGCAFTISPASQSVPAAGGTGTVAVTTTADCAWTAASGAPWATITSGASGTGPGAVGFSAAANTAIVARSTTLTVAGKTFTLSQGAAACVYTVTPLTLTVAGTPVTGTIAVTAPAGCAWAAATTAPWITLTGSGSGNGSAAYAIAPNPNLTPRTATLTVAGKTVNVTQAAAVKPSPPLNLRIVR